MFGKETATLRTALEVGELFHAYSVVECYLCKRKEREGGREKR